MAGDAEGRGRVHALLRVAGPALATNLDLVIAMGAPMSVNDEASLPWLKSEKKFIRQAIRRGLPVVGICLGPQLIANALGA